jgi:hypothetical protein
VSNTGLSADHVASATHTRVRTVAIRSLTAPTGAGMRAEHLDLDGSTVGVFRPSPAELGPIPEPVSFEPGMAVVRSPAAVGPGVRTFGQSQPVPLDRAERLRALAGVRLSTPITRPRVTTIRADPGWLSPHARGLQGPALPVAREAVAESAAAPVEVPRYSSPAERTRIASGPMRTESTHVRSAPVVSAPERSSSSSWQNAGGQSRGR